MKVFIADDSAIFLERLKAMISEIPEIEIVGESGEVQEAIKAIGKLKPDIVVLDIKMPGGSGMDVLRNIKNKRSGPVVIMLTNYPYLQYKKKCMDLGADLFFYKLTEFEKVAESIDRLIHDFQT